MSAVATVLAVALVLIAGGAVAYAVATIHEKQLHEKQTEVERATPGVVDDPSTFLAEEAALVGSGPLEVPVYREDVLVRDNEGCFTFARDSGFRTSYNYRTETFERLQEIFPSAAMRRAADGGSVYVMYDTDAGGRLYVFFSEKDHYMFEDGFPVLMKKRLAYEDFAGVEVGDGIGDVESVDPAATVYRGVFDRYSDREIENWIKFWRLPPTSVHLLVDGMLKIEYRRDGALGYAVTNVVYDADFVLDGLDGRTRDRASPSPSSAASCVASTLPPTIRAVAPHGVRWRRSCGI